MAGTRGSYPGSSFVNGTVWTMPSQKNSFMEAFDFEVYDIPWAVDFMVRYRPWMLAAIALYVSSAFAGQALMANRAPFKLRSALTWWNIALAAFSIFGTFRTFPEWWYNFKQEDGFYKSVCVVNLENHNYATSFWAFIFTLSKLIELGDTAFIVLRKQKLIFLHWYHHVTVLAMTWVYFENYETCFRWFGLMNFFVHSCMYTYYALKSLQFKIPRPLAMAITILQIVQMIVGLYINVFTWWIRHNNVPCKRTMFNIYFGLTIYGSYFILFLNFFRKAYFSKGSKKKAA